jgi:hypothetical protein
MTKQEYKTWYGEFRWYRKARTRCGGGRCVPQCVNEFLHNYPCAAPLHERTVGHMIDVSVRNKPLRECISPSTAIKLRHRYY